MFDKCNVADVLDIPVFDDYGEVFEFADFETQLKICKNIMKYSDVLKEFDAIKDGDDYYIKF